MSIRVTQDEFISRAKKVWGERYDLSKVHYVTSKDKIDVICKEHGLFHPQAGNFLRGHGCPICGNISGGKKITLTQEEYIQKVYDVWGDRYDLSKVVYNRLRDKIIIGCKKHGDFLVSAGNFLSGYGCPKCGIEKKSAKLRKNTETFIRQAREIHGDRYDYSLAEYNTEKDKVTIISPKHGVFLQTATAHISGHGCPSCAREQISESKFKTQEEFIKQAKKVHDGKYDYSKVRYTGCRNKIIITCPKHGDFEQDPNSHLQGRGCPACQESHGEKLIRKILRQSKIKFRQEKIFDDCRDKRVLRFDFYLPDKNTCIEFQGQQHYILEPFFEKEGNGLEDRKRRDQIKRDYCKLHGIILLEIKYTDNIVEKLKNII